MSVYKNLKLCRLFFSLLFVLSWGGINAAEYYWIGGSGNWSDISHWATSSGGFTTYFTVPAAADNVHFDFNSFNSSKQTVTVNTSAVCKELNWTGARFTPTFTCSSNFSLRIYSSLTLISDMNFSFVGNVYFESTSTGKNIFTAGKTFGSNMYFQGIGGGWTLRDELKVNGTLNLVNGTFNSNANKLNLGKFNSDNTNSRSLTVANSKIVAAEWKLNGTGLTLNASNSEITASTNFTHTGSPKTYSKVTTKAMIAGGSSFIAIASQSNLIASGILDADTIISASNLDLQADFVEVVKAHGITNLRKGILYKNVILDYSATIDSVSEIKNLSIASNLTINSTIHITKAVFGGNAILNCDNNFDSLILSPGKKYTLKKNSTQTISKNISINGNCGGYISILSSVAGIRANISISSGNITGNYLIMKDINAIGGANFSVNNFLDQGNNSGWINNFTQSNLYWVGGTGNWSDANHWSTTSGGSAGGCLPNPYVNVHFDANSFASSNESVTIDTNIAYCRDMIWTTASNNPTFKSQIGHNLHVFSSISLVPAMTLSFLGDIYFDGSVSGKTIDFANNTIDGNIYFEGINGSWTLQGSLNCKKTIFFDKGILSTNNNNVSCSLFSAKDTSTRILNISNSTISTKKWDVNGINLTLNASNSRIIDIVDFIHVGTPKVYNNISSTNPLVNIKGGRSIFNLITTSTGTLNLSNDNIIDSLIVLGTLSLIDNDTINYVYVKASAQIGNVSATNHQVINRVVCDSIGSIYGNNFIKYLRIDKTGLISGNNVIGNAYLYSDANINGSNRFDTLSLFAGNVYKLQYNKKQTINGQLNLDGRCSAFITLESSDILYSAEISKTSNAIIGNYLILKSIKVTGGASFTANNSIGLGVNNLGWTINSIAASNLYWVGGSGNWSDSSHWSLSSGGVGNNCIPGPLDNVFFDAYSFTAIGQTVKMDIINANCENMEWTGARFNPTFDVSSGKTIHIFGSLTLIPSMNFLFNGIANFDATVTGKTILSAGKIFKSDINFTGMGGEWTINDSLTVTGSINILNGKFISNSNKISCSNFNSAYSSTREINISNSTISAKTWSVAGTNLVFNASNSNIKDLNNFTHTSLPADYNNLSSTIASFSLKGGNSTFNSIISKGTLKLQGNNFIQSLYVYGNAEIINNNKIDFIQVKGTASIGSATPIYNQFIKKALFDSSATIYGNNKFDYLKIMKNAVIQGIDTFGNVILNADASIDGNHIFDTLTFAAGKTYTLQDGKTQTIKTLLNINGNNCFPTIIQSKSTVAISTISKSTGSVIADYVELRNVNASGGASFNLYSSIGIGNDTGWTINSSSPLNLYWIGGSGNWSDLSHWSTTSGGTANACIPSAVDNVFFDLNSFSATGQTVKIDLPNSYCNNMNWTTAQFNPTFDVPTGKIMHFYGSLTLIPAMNFSFNGIANFDSKLDKKIIVSAGKKFGSDINFMGQAGEWTLNDSLTVVGSINVIKGELISNSNKISCLNFSSPDSNVREINISNSVINVKTWTVNGRNLKFDANNSYLNGLSSFTHLYIPKDYHNITLSNSGSYNFKGGDSKFNLITVSSGTLKLQGNNTIDSLIVNGSAEITNNNYIQFIKVKGNALIGSTATTYKQQITKAIFESSASIYGENNIGFFSVVGNALIQGSNIMGNVFLYSDGSINGNNVFDSLTFSSGRMYLLQEGSTQTINYQFNISGNNCFPTSIRSNKVGSLTTIYKASDKVSADFIELRDVQTTGGASFFAGSHSSDLGNNSGWDFSTSPNFIYGLGNDTILCYGDYLRSNNTKGAKTFVWHDNSTKPYFEVNQSGTYWLTASFGQGCSYADTIIVLKVNARPKASFLVNDTMQCVANNKFDFTSTSKIDSGFISGYSWDFGDGQSNNSNNPSHSYLNADTFNLIFIAESSLGCRDTAWKSVYVNDPPIAAFTINDSSQCLSVNNFIFNNNTSLQQKGAGNYYWDFGDGFKSNLPNPSHSYPIAKNYSIMLVSSSIIGCSDTFVSSVIVNKMPKADFMVKPIYQDEIANFTDRSSIIIPDSIDQWKWTYGDGSSSNNQNPDYSYSSPGNFWVSLTVTSNNGCKDSIKKSVYIRPRISPPIIEKVSVSTYGSEIEIAWSAPKTGFALSYVLERGTDGTDYKIIHYPDRFTDHYFDASVKTDTISYYYRIKAIDSFSNSDYSNIGKSIVLHVSNIIHSAELSWSAYEEWAEGVDRYEIEVFNDKISDFISIGSVDGNTLEFNDDATALNQSDYCYRVAAISNNDEKIAYSNSDCVPITFSCYLPNAFTPNNDGLNDILLASGYSVSKFNLKIFDRWGTLLFETSDIKKGWDGTYKAEKLPVGYYYFQMLATSIKNQKLNKKGTITLLQ